MLFPLVREAVAGLDLRAWLRFARRVADPRRAAREGIIVVVRHPRRMPCGLFVYHKEHELGHGPVLVAEHFVAVDLLDPAPVMSALIDELDALAHRLDCTAIRAMVMSKSSQIVSRLHEAGLRPAGEALWKPLAEPGNGKSTVSSG
jgi:hypothetical protein